MRILAHEERTIRSGSAPVVTNGLCDGQDVRFIESSMEWGSAMAARSEAHPLIRITRIRPALVIIAYKPRHIDQDFFWSRLSG